MTDKIKYVMDFLLIGSLLLTNIVLPDVVVVNKYQEMMTNPFTEVFGTQPDKVMKVIYAFLPVMAAYVILCFLRSQIIVFCNSRQCKKFNALWISPNDEMLDIFFICYEHKILLWPKQLVKKFIYDRYDLKTGKSVLNGFIIFYNLTFYLDESDSRTHNKVLISACNNNDEKIFIEICLHIDDKECDYASVYHNLKTRKNYNNKVKIERHDESNNLLKLKYNNNEFREKYEEIVKKVLEDKRKKIIERQNQ
jgi:hypothetical protein